MPTENRYAHEWDKVFVSHRVVVSHRSTTSSRRPGRAIEGAVTYAAGSVGLCLDCGCTRRIGDTPHAPRIERRNGRHVRVDCAGREV